jgi:hypothetical protein
MALNRQDRRRKRRIEARARALAANHAKDQEAALPVSPPAAALGSPLIKDPERQLPSIKGMLIIGSVYMGVIAILLIIGWFLRNWALGSDYLSANGWKSVIQQVICPFLMGWGAIIMSTRLPSRYWEIGVMVFYTLLLMGWIGVVVNQQHAAELEDRKKEKATDALICSNAFAEADGLYEQARAYRASTNWDSRDVHRIEANLGLDVDMDYINSHPHSLQAEKLNQLLTQWMQKQSDLRNQEVKDFLEQVPQMEQAAAQIYVRLGKRAPDMNILSVAAMAARARPQLFGGSMVFEMVGDYLRDTAHQLCPVGKK